MNGRLGPLPKHVEEQIRTAARMEPLVEARLTLPMPPTVNHYWVHVIIKGTARIALGSVGKKYRKDVGAAVAAAGSPRLLAGRLEFHAVVYPATRQQWDLDNRLKPLLDALVEAGVMADDSLIDHLTIRRGPVSPNPRAEVVIRPVPTTGLFADPEGVAP